MASPDFGKSVNEFSTRGADYAHYITYGPSVFLDFPTVLCRINGLDAVFSVSQLHHAKCCDAWHRHYVACLSTQRSQPIKVKLKPNMTRLLFFSAKNKTFMLTFDS